MAGEVLYKERSYEIVNAAITVWTKLGYGFLEKVYENALAHELKRRSIAFAQQGPVNVWYDGALVGEFYADIVVDDEIILELKSAEAIAPAHMAQALNYLKATEKRLAIILNFGPNQLEFKRVVR